MPLGVLGRRCCTPSSPGAPCRAGRGAPLLFGVIHRTRFRRAAWWEGLTLEISGPPPGGWGLLFNEEDFLDDQPPEPQHAPTHRRGTRPNGTSSHTSDQGDSGQKGPPHATPPQDRPRPRSPASGSTHQAGNPPSRRPVLTRHRTLTLLDHHVPDQEGSDHKTAHLTPPLPKAALSPDLMKAATRRGTQPCRSLCRG